MQLQNKRKIERTWEHTRYLAAMVHNSSMGKKRNRTPAQLVPLSIDRNERVPDITMEEAEHLIKVWKVDKKRKPKSKNKI